MRLLHTRAAPADAVFTRIASVTPSTGTNIFTATLSASTDVKRGNYVERLGTWRPFPARVPLLDSHERSSVNSVLGFVDGFRVENGALIGDLHVSESRPAISTLLRERAVESVSVGFTAENWVDSTENGARVRTGEGLNLREISLVTIPADDGARLRQEQNDESRIRDLGAALRVPAGTIEALVTRNLGFDVAAGELVRAAAAAGPQIQTRNFVTTWETAPGDLGRSFGAALAARYGAINADAVPAQARMYTQERFPQLCARYCEAQGISIVGLSEASIIKRAMTTSDFPILVGEFLNLILQSGYRAAPSPLMALVRNITVTDFHDVHLPRLSQSPLLEQIVESGEVSFGALSESEEKFSVGRWGKGLTISFVLMVNDRLGAINDQIRSWGYSVSETESRQLIALLTQNAGLGPTLKDTKPLFDAAHNNVLTPAAAPAETSFDGARVAMRRQVDRFGQLLGLSPLYVLCPPEQETAARKQVASVTATAVVNVNAFSAWSVLIDARLSDHKRWYTFADPAVAPTFVRATLSGFPGPVSQAMVDFLTDNTLVKVNHNFGFGTIDWVGANTNQGA